MFRIRIVERLVEKLTGKNAGNFKARRYASVLVAVVYALIVLAVYYLLRG